MRLTRLFPAAGAALALALTATACGDSTGPVSMTQGEASALFSTVFQEVFTGFIQSGGDAATLAAGVSVSCEGGGTALVKGTSTATQDNLNIAFTGCHSGTFIVDGSITFTGTTTSASIKGDLTISGSKTGSCNVDVTISTSGQTSTASGSVCGVNVSGLQTA